MEPLFSPVRLGPVELRNRVVKAATFEGMATDGLVTDELIEYHRRPAAGGVGMSTVAYLSVSSDGRTYRHQLWSRDELVPGLRRLVDTVHAEGAAVAVQLGHAGWFANPHASGLPNLGPSRRFSPHAMNFSTELTHADMERLLDDFAGATRRCIDAGVDALEVHLGHGYLLSQFLSPWTNRRRDEYGGGIEDRARFPRRVLERVRATAGDRAAVTAKLNMEDGFRSGLQADDALAVARMIEDDATVDALQLTVGFTARTPMDLLRGDAPISGMVANERHPVRRLGMRLFAPLIVKDLPYSEAFLLPLARRFRAEVDLPLMLLGGITRLDTMRLAMDEGFEFVAMARALLHDPDLVQRMQRGDLRSSGCTHCNRCIVEMERDGTRCVLLPPVVTT